MERRDFLQMAVGFFTLPLLGNADGVDLSGAFYKAPSFDPSQLRWTIYPYGADDAHIGTLLVEHYCKCGKRFDMMKVALVTKIKEQPSEELKLVAIQNLKRHYDESVRSGFVTHGNCPLQPTVTFVKKTPWRVPPA